MKNEGSLKVFIKLAGLGTLASLAFGSIANAGTRDGGGGVGVRCSLPGQTSSLELLDLHEARLKGLTIRHNPTTKEQAIDLAARLIAEQNGPSPFSPDISQNEASIKKNLVAPLLNGDFALGLRADVVFVEWLPVSSDAGNYTIAPGCQLEQIAYFSDTDLTLYVVEKKWAELSWLDKAALAAHESVFYQQRHSGFIEDFSRLKEYAKTSERVRLFVGKLFSEEGLAPKVDAGIDRNAVTCVAEGTAFSAQNQAQGGVSIVVYRLYDLTSPFRVSAVIGNIQDIDFLDIAKGEFQEESELTFSDEKVDQKFMMKLTKKKGSRPKIQVSTFDFKGSSVDLVPEMELLACWK